MAITPRGRKLALRLGKKLKFPVFLPEKLCQAGDEAEAFTVLKETLPALFQEKKQLVLIMATGIAVRILAPHLQGKSNDPAVVVVDDGGLFAISLLSGHLGGANMLARRVAECLGAVPVITTATDVAGLRAVDALAYDFNLKPEPVEKIKEFNAAMLKGETIFLYTDWPESVFGKPAGIAIKPLFNLTWQKAKKYRAVLTHNLNLPGLVGNELMLRPKNLFVGIGCRRGVTAAQIIGALETVFNGHNLALGSIAKLASIEEKKTEAGLLEAAQKLKVPLCLFPAAELREVKYSYEKSEFVEKTMGVGSVCVPAAILVARSSKVLVPKQKLKQITIAVVEDESPWLALDPGIRLT